MKVTRKVCLINKSKLPTQELADLTRFVLTFLRCRKKNVKIVVRDARVERGVAWGHKIKIWLPKNRWPRTGNTGRHRNFPHYMLHNWKEGYVTLLAHEAAHIMGETGARKGEWQCELNACAALLTYRSLQ